MYPATHFSSEMFPLLNLAFKPRISSLETPAVEAVLRSISENQRSPLRPSLQWTCIQTVTLTVFVYFLFILWLFRWLKLGKQSAASRARMVPLEHDVVQGKRILLVEDERTVREALRLLLSRDSHTVVEANNGAEAFALFIASKFDLVMTDFEMPFVKGNELAVKIRRVAPKQPILMVTAFEHRPNPENPVDAVMQKPFDCAQLRQKMNFLLSQASPTPASCPRCPNKANGTQAQKTEICADHCCSRCDH